MDVQAGSLVRTIAGKEISEFVGKIVSELQTELTSVVGELVSASVSAPGVFKLENRLAECVRESAQKVL